MEEGSERIGFAILFIISIYVLPTGVAMLRRVRNAGSVAIINVFLGLTIIGYVIALAMAVMSNQPRSA